MAGRTRLYTFDTRYPLPDELTAFLAKAMTFYPPQERDRLLLARQEGEIEKFEMFRKKFTEDSEHQSS
jgi:hypothetical protein